MGSFSDVFRFVCLRESDRVDDVRATPIDASTLRGSGLLARLAQARSGRDPGAGLAGVASAYVRGALANSSAYAGSLTALDPRLAWVDEAVRDEISSASVDAVRRAIVTIGIDGKTIAEWRARLRDSLNASIVLGKESAADLQSLERASRIVEAIARMRSRAAYGPSDLREDLTRTIAVSSTVFPLPRNDAAAKKAEEGHEKAVAGIERYNASVTKFKSRLHENRLAIDELTRCYKRDWELARVRQSATAPATPPTKRSDGVGRRLRPRRTEVARQRGAARGIVGVPPRVLPPEQANKLSETTTRRLAALGMDPAGVDVVTMVGALEDDNQLTGRRLYQGVGRLLAGRLGADYVALDPGVGVFTGDDDDAEAGVPGACLLVNPDTPTGDTDLPSGVGRFQSLGVADLNVVRQRLIRYATGEVAHIENVMASETRDRTHRHLSRTEEFTSAIIETTNEQEHDLQTTSRYELQREISDDVVETSRTEAGMTVSGSYGMSVEFTANAGFASEKSSTKASRLSTSYSQEVVDRAVQRLQEKVREERTRLSIDELEVLNKHAFKNDEQGASHISGVYRWVDKEYEAQLFNYGKREIIEVVIPEPAAFYRYVATTTPSEGSTVSRPIEPGYCTDEAGTFVPLTLETLTVDNYQFWVSVYNVADVEPPPPEFKLVGTAFHQDPVVAAGGEETSAAVNYSNATLQVPDGYEVTRAWFTMPFTLWPVTGQVAIGRQKITFFNPDDWMDPAGAYEVEMSGETGTVPIAASLSTAAFFAATVEIECARTEDALARWFMATYNAVMNKYELLKAEYDDTIARSQEELATVVEGRNPLMNRMVERAELKRLVISQMTGQAFEAFDAMRAKVAPLGYPQHDIEDAWSEGRYVRFVEQAFEWENMQYLFYPYFWGRKEAWPRTSRLDDPDPLFTAFLQAGYSRVNLPVRPGFEKVVNVFLSTGQVPWSGDDAPLVSPDDLEPGDTDPFLTIAEEMKGQLGAVHLKTGGTVSYVAGDDVNVLSGAGTAFTEDDLNRDISLLGLEHRITAVNVESQKLTVDGDMQAALQAPAEYAIGAKAVGVAWRVVVPTSLVLLAPDSNLNG